MDTKKWTPKKSVCILAGIAVCILFCIIPAPATLNNAAISVGSSGSLAMRILGITFLSVCWWVGDVFPDWVTTIAMMLLWSLIGEFPFSSAFSSFSGSTVWMIVGAFCLASAVTRTGLFTRISWFLIRIFSPTYRRQMLALIIVGAVCAPLIPSLTAKAVLGVTIANGVANAMGYERNSRGRYGLCLAAWIGFGATAPAFVSGSVFGYTLLGALPAGITITWGSWCIAMLPWLIIVLIGSYLALQIIYKPNETAAITKEYVTTKYKELGKLNGKELISALILTGTVLMWVLESVVKIDASVTALAAAFLCFAMRILDYKDISTAPNWGFVIFFGGVLSLGNVFSATGINVWLQEILSPLFERLGNPFLAAVILFILVILIRFVLVSQSATIIIMMAVLSPVSQAIGLSPFIIGIITYTAVGIWFVSYQNTTFVTAFTCMKNTLEYKGTAKGCAAFATLSLVACLISIPYWSLLNHI